MVLSNKERQAKYRASKKGAFKKLEVLLPNNEAKLLHDNANSLGITKADYIVRMLHDNSLLHDTVLQGEYDS
ncbi:MAG: hypothetical protein QM500_05225 [Methylococcales bacterium]